MDNKKIIKCRIQLLDEDLRVINDRLVDQNLEFTNGPKEKHSGPIRLEVNITCSQDIDSLKTYLDTLAGSLPIKEISGRGRPSAGTKELLSPREDIYSSIEQMAKDGESQDKIIKYLRGLDFVFLLTEDFLNYFPDFKFKTKDIGEPNTNGQYPTSLSWMVRRSKKSKNPLSDKYDPQILFGFQVMGTREDKVVGYLYKERKSYFKAKVPTKNALAFNQMAMCKMPAYMTSEERLKWSTEMRQLTLDKERKPSKFFIRWSPDIQVPTVTQEKLSHLNLRFK